MVCKLSEASLKILATVRPELQKVVHRAAELSTVPFAIVSGNRTQTEQDLLYSYGRTRPGRKITWTRNSRHIGGRAIDYSLLDASGKPSNLDPKTWKVSLYKPVAEALKKAGAELGTPVEWLMDLAPKTGDLGHIQLKKK